MAYETKSLDPIVATAIWVGFPGERLGHTTSGFACNCPVPEAWEYIYCFYIYIAAKITYPHFVLNPRPLLAEAVDSNPSGVKFLSEYTRVTYVFPIACFLMHHAV